jgi:hypothetical protein
VINFVGKFRKVQLINSPFFHPHSLQLSRLSWWLWLSLNLQHHAAPTCRHRQEMDLELSHRASMALHLRAEVASLLSQEPTMVHQPSSQEPTMELQPNSQELTTVPQLNSLAQTMVLQLSNPAPTTAHHRLHTEPHKPRTSTTSTANAPTATNKPHPTPTESHQLTATATPTTDTHRTVDTQTEAMKNQPSTNSNTMFKTNKLVSISDTRNNAKDQSPLANTTFSCPMAVNK